MSTGEAWTLGHRPALDGLRGIAVLLVVVAHAHVPLVRQAGMVGVTVFFTLSGFLITSLLLEERARRGRISLASFYRRRALRLLPALGVFLGMMVVFSVALSPVFMQSGGDLALASLYLANWKPALTGEVLGGINHVWSLSVEEQFYIVWPLLLLAMRRASRRVLVALIGGGIVASVGLRFALWDGGGGVDRVYYGTDTHADALLVGCLVAVMLHGSRGGRRVPAAVAPVAVAPVVLGGFLSTEAALLGAALVVPWLTAAVIVVVAQRRVPWLESAPLVAAGRRSYGLYLWHYPLLAVLPTLVDVSWWVTVPVMLVLTVVATEASWRYVETPFLRLKSRASANADRPVSRLSRPPLHDALTARQP